VGYIFFWSWEVEVKLTISVHSWQHEAVDCSDRGEEQCCGQACVAKPFCFSREYAGGYEDVVSVYNGKYVLLFGRVDVQFLVLQNVGNTYSTREPGPYCPETGQAHTTFSTSEEEVLATVLLLLRISSWFRKGLDWRRAGIASFLLFYGYSTME